MAGDSFNLVAKLNVNVSGHGSNNANSNNKVSSRHSQGGGSHHKEGVISGFLRHISGSGGLHMGGGNGSNNQSPGRQSIGGQSIGGLSIGGQSMRSGGSVKNPRKAIESGTLVHFITSHTSY